LNRGGLDPKGLAAATIYIAARDTNEHRTQTQVANVAQITEVTLRTRAKYLIQYVKDSILIR
jgi:transcription initiation factor TFIIB